jgi:hypothetical protein
VLLSVHHADWLRELAGTYELVWATTWEHHANTHIAPLLELPALPVVAFAGYRSRPDAPQFGAVEGLLGRKWARCCGLGAGDRSPGWTM